MEQYINNIIKVSDINYLSELIPPAFLRKQEGGINSPKQLTSFDFTQDVILSIVEGLRSLSFRKLWAH